ncbi:hypothetical protein O0I10_001261 [Lichtheimia ornata]|uniref:CNNM transmembrane domain-containing protein n=1 Tax=Lichtheimia ornata TaxID=688661 RepID=A0AAD7Y3F2_9FUNG|nr:uncharacterized protein O0I10_001261 [Lichtheimia ornata]KAJ8663084.1 hypothetical protein O0I10_001261 [Lichtheimia ornata]
MKNVFSFIVLLLLQALIFSITQAADEASSTTTTTANVQEEASSSNLSSAQFWGQIIAIIALVVCSGIVAGLTLGLMSQDVTNLAILSAAGTPKQRKYAARIMPIRKNGHLLLTALLLTNTVLNETLPVLIDGLFGQGYLAIILSTVLIVLFSEIIPQAVCSRNGLAIGAFFAIPVRVLIGFWYIIAWPISKILDKCLGKHHGFVYNVSELCELIGLHSNSNSNQLHPGPLDQSTTSLLQCILKVSEKTAGDLLYSPHPPPQHHHHECMLYADDAIDNALLGRVVASGYAALPVYDRILNQQETKQEAVIGTITASKLFSVLHYNSSEKKTIRDLTLDPVIEIPASTRVLTLLQLLQNEPCK